MERPHAMSQRTDDTILREITSIGRFQPRVFSSLRRPKEKTVQTEQQIVLNAEGMKALQMKNAKIQRNINNIDADIKVLQSEIDRHRKYMAQLKKDHDDQVVIMKQQIENRKAQIAEIDKSPEPPTINQIRALVQKIEVEGMAAKRRAENCLRDQDVNIVLSGDRLRKFHDYLGPKISDTILQENPSLRKAYDRMEKAVYRTAEIQTQLRSLRIYSTNLERKLIEMNSAYEALQFEKQDVQMGIVDKKEELHAELTKRSEELGKLRWKIEYLKSLKGQMNLPRFDVRNIP